MRQNRISEMDSLGIIRLCINIVQQVESKLRETTARLEQQLAEEQKARLAALANAKEAQAKSDDEIRKLREHLERAERENEEFRKHAARCAIL